MTVRNKIDRLRCLEWDLMKKKEIMITQVTTGSKKDVSSFLKLKQSDCAVIFLNKEEIMYP